MDFFNFGNLAACCTCNRKPDESWKTGGSAENEYYQRGGAHTDKNRPRIEKPQLGGVGIVFQGTEDGGLQVSSIMANGPAAVSGLVNEGDLLITVNGGSIDGMTDQQLARNLLGPLGSRVTLGLQKADGMQIDAELSRAFTSKQRATAASVDGNKGS